MKIDFFDQYEKLTRPSMQPEPLKKDDPDKLFNLDEPTSDVKPEIPKQLNEEDLIAKITASVAAMLKAEQNTPPTKED